MKISSAIFIFFTIISPAFLNLSCWTLPVTQKPEENPRILLRTIPEQEPEWKNILPHDNNQIYFVGASRAFRTETDARNAAREDARIQILKYYGQYIKNTSKESTVLRGNSNDILNPYIERVDEFVSFAESVVKQIQADRYYTEVYYTPQKSEEFIVYVLCQIKRESAEHEINTFAERISARYRSLLDTAYKLGTLAGVIESFQKIRSALSENPLERALAYYQTEQGNPSLYDYVCLMINSLSQSVIISVDNINNTTPINIKKGESLRLSVKVSTDKFNIIGGAYCKVSITGMGAKIPEAVYKIEPDNLFYLIIHTAKYFAGYYNAHIELMLDKTAQEIRKNPEYNFSFTVLSSVSHQENPLLLPAGEYWEGHITYNFNGKSYTDIYTILFDEFEGKRLCRISLKSLSLEKETSFLGDGTWSIKGEFIEIKGFLNGSKSNRSIHWTSSYKFTAKNSFALLVPPYPDASNARIVFMRTKK